MDCGVCQEQEVQKPYFVKVEIEVPKYCRLHFRVVERFLAFTFNKSPSSADGKLSCWESCYAQNV
ncbi:unnamed protein product [Nesidiocoris tenuis]|uniref:Uncharacterized protein n=1 Tax=Nesidiocoris tenuis TaxID=355587 RepID=A0A6H5GPY3_9HEMI|nr:unnamed protein product [Nesidiocoris tenuis]